MEIAKYLVAFVAIFNFGGVVADAFIPAGARQHLFNPRWPPHAKFHNGQTMLMGVASGSLSLTILVVTKPLSFPTFLIAAAVASNYFIAMALAPMFPGVAWADPEFMVGRPSPFGLAPQQLISYALCSLVLIAIALATVSR